MTDKKIPYLEAVGSDRVRVTAKVQARLEEAAAEGGREAPPVRDKTSLAKALVAAFTGQTMGRIRTAANKKPSETEG